MPMDRSDAIDVLAGVRGDALSVATMQTLPRWHENGMAEGNLDCLGCMGGASSLGLGLAIAQPDRKVMVLDGDGSLLMQLGTLVSVAESGAKNFYHFVFENGMYETTGRQVIPSRGTVDFAALASAAGYRHAHSFDSVGELREAIGDVLNEEGPVLIRLAIDPASERLPFPPGLNMAAEVRALEATLRG